MTGNEARRQELPAEAEDATEFAVAALLEQLCISSLNDDDDAVAELSMLLRHALQNASDFHS